MIIKITTDFRCPYCDCSHNCTLEWDIEKEGDIEILCDYCENTLLSLEVCNK